MTMNTVPLSILRMQLEAIKVSMEAHTNARELALAKTKIEECIMWLNQHLLLNPDHLEVQEELPILPKVEVATPAAPVKKKVVKAEPKVEVQEVKVVEETKLPTKEEMIQLAKDFGKKNGIEAFLNLLKPFNCKNVSEVYEIGKDAIQQFYNSLNA